MKRATPWLLALAVWALVFAIPSLDDLEMLSLDARFRLPGRNITCDSRLALIVVDEKTLNADSFDGVPNPLRDQATGYWLPHFGRVIRGLLEQGAHSVALDWIPWDIPEAVYRVVLPDMKPDEFPWTDLFEAANQFPGRWIQAVGADDPRSRELGRTWSSHKAADEILAFVGRENIAYVNLSLDDDEVMRHQVMVRLPVRKSEQEAWGVDSLPYFGARIAEGAGLKIEPSQLEEKHFLRINYLPPGMRFPAYSFGEVFAWCKHDPAKLKAAFAGKVVLIGASSPIFHDVFYTPVGLLPGVEIHANVINTLFRQLGVGRLSRPAEVALVLAFSLLGVALAVLRRPQTAAIFCVSLMLVYTAFALAIFLKLSFWVPVVRPVFSLAASCLLMVLVRVRRDEKIQAEVRSLFGRYVSDEVMQQLLEHPGQTIVGAVGKKRVTVLFSDINGFTTQCERRTPEEVLRMLNEYFYEMNEIIFTYGGTIKQFVGDEIMVMYGAPASHPHAEIGAVRTAVDMSKRLAELKRADPEGLRGFYDIKVGIHTGDVILGNVGSKRRTEYAAVGDDVNLGSRIMGMTKALHAEILISAETYEKVKDLEGIRFVQKGKHPVKGRKELVEIYEVLAEEEK